MHIDARKIASMQADLTVAWHDLPPIASGLGFDRLVCENHLRNFQLWHEEDSARRKDLGFQHVYQAKRAIDCYNQERNNLMEEMDNALVVALRPKVGDCPKNSETPGMIIDRLSILALKEFHMREESMREETDELYRANCAIKLSRILLQRDDLTRSLAELIEAVMAGTRTFAVYYQFKMYNAPSPDSQLNRRVSPAGA